MFCARLVLHNRESRLDKTLDYRGEMGRKALHLLALVLPASMLILPRPWSFALLVGLALLAIAMEIGRSRPGPIRQFIDGTFGWMMRPQERVPGSGFCGATWVVTTAALLFAAFEPRVAAAGMAMALTGDAAAALVGRSWGRNPWPGSKRTVEGSAAFVAAALLVSVLFPGPGWVVRGLAAVGAALAEVVPIPLNDNLVLPFVTAGLLTLLA